MYVFQIPGQHQIYEDDKEKDDNEGTFCGSLFKSIEQGSAKYPPKPKRIHAEFQRKYMDL